jgi:alkanesulfonate monooxygenase SsuD/methylene tetrahydromethanopterin reductase-like flavin-dependent oxidoreductase (luciferase family)
MKETLRIGIFDWIEAPANAKAAELYAHKLELAAAADRAGLHAYLIAEHQGTPLSINAQPSVLLSAMIQRTTRLRVGALTFCLPWYNPYRLYNEICMLDQLSRGRLEMGVGRGVSPIESKVFGLAGIEESRDKYRETLDIFFAACQSDSLTYQGKHYRYDDAELHLKPYQKPYPPLWFPSSNRESIEFTARHGYHTAVLAPTKDVKPLFDQYREVWEKHRNDANRHNAHVADPYLAKTQHLVIAENGAEAKRIGEEAHNRWASRIHHLVHKFGRPEHHKTDPYAPDTVQPLITGTPQIVLEKLSEMLRATSANYLLCILSFGDLAPEHVMRSLELLRTEVMPKLAGVRS